MSIAESWQSAFRDRVVVVSGRAQFITLQYHDALVGFLNVYAPNQASARAEFWVRLATSLPSVDSWCVGGDFNMLESLRTRLVGVTLRSTRVS